MTRRTTTIVGSCVFVLAFAVYLITLTPTVPFWDSGEFIAVSNILGIPHPPGTPFYVLLGHLASLVPIATIAQRVNALSGFASAIAVLVTYLVALRLIRLAQGRGQTGDVMTGDAGTSAWTSEWMAQVGAVVAALMLAFSDNFWENAIEAEVYSMMSMAQILVFWLGLKWWDAHEKKPTVGPLLLCIYVMWVSVGLHLGVGMMGLPLVLLVGLVDRNVALMLAMPIVSVLGVTYGLERMVGIVLVFSIVTYAVYAYQKKLPWPVWLISAASAGWALVPAFGDANFDVMTGSAAAIALALPLVVMWPKAREGRIIALAFVLMIVGYSTHLYLPIRAAQHPAVNEGNPSNWDSLRYLLERKQYGETSMFTRRGPWSAQLNKEFWRYWNRQWTLFPTAQANRPGVPAREPAVWQSLLPLLLGLLGGWWQRKNRVSWLTTGCLFAFATVGMILFLNFTDHEVRDRDYFYTTGYHTFAIWIGLGVTWLIGWVRDSFQDGGLKRAATVFVTAILALQPFLVLRTLWFTHDRRGNYVAHDYAYNMLEPLAPNSFVFTNGDNDTFPLWYIQNVEHVRQDVRVINLSLLNTDWYIQQLKDEEPKVPISLDNRTIKELGAGAVQDSTGRLIYTNQFMVAHIMAEDRTATGWKKQPYFAVTVPEHMGFERQFSLEGLVYRVNTDTLHAEVDEEATRRALYQTFKYRGLFNEDGSWNTKVYKDENASTLSRNYAAAHLQLAFLYRHQGKIDQAIAEMERVARMFPDYTDVLIPLGGFYMDKGDTAKAVELFQQLVSRSPGNIEAHYYLGVTQIYRGKIHEALHEFDACIQIDPNYSQAYLAAYYSLKQVGNRDLAISYLSRWVDSHPTDAQARQLLDNEQLQLHGAAPKNSALPHPPTPSLP
jgi:DNA-binding SARP family transcriptional activator